VEIHLKAGEYGELSTGETNVVRILLAGSWLINNESSKVVNVRMKLQLVA
jgi:hypothetical protein